MAGKQNNTANKAPGTGATELSKATLDAALAGATNPALRKRLEAALKPKTDTAPPSPESEQPAPVEARRATRQIRPPQTSHANPEPRAAEPPAAPTRSTPPDDHPDDISASEIFPNLERERLNHSGWFDDQPEMRHLHRVGLIDIHTAENANGTSGHWVAPPIDQNLLADGTFVVDPYAEYEEPDEDEIQPEDVAEEEHPPSDMWRAYSDGLAWEVKRRTAASGLASVKSMAVRRFREGRRRRRAGGVFGSRPALGVAVFLTVFLAAGHITSLSVDPTDRAVVAGFGPTGESPPVDAPNEATPVSPPPAEVTGALSVDDAAGSTEAARRHFDAGRFTDTISAASRAISAGSASVEAYVLRGRAHIALYTSAEAVQDLEQALQMDPENIGVQFYLARAYLIGQRPDDAHRHFAAIAEKQPELIEAHIGRGYARLVMGDVEGALKLAEAAFTETHGGPEALDLRSRARALSGDLDGALKDCDQLAVVVGAGVAQQWCSGTALALSGQTDLAAASYEAALRNASAFFIESRQRQMLSLGLYNGPIDGTFGPALRDALPACASNRYCS